MDWPGTRLTRADYVAADPAPVAIASIGRSEISLRTGATDDVELTIGNIGSLPFTWSIDIAYESIDDFGLQEGWAVASTASGTASGGTAATPSIELDMSGIPTGRYRARIIVTTDDPKSPEFDFTIEATVNELLPAVAMSSASFAGPHISSGAYAIVLRGIEKATSMIRKFAACFTDKWMPSALSAPSINLLPGGSRGLCTGYENLDRSRRASARSFLCSTDGQPERASESTKSGVRMRLCAGRHEHAEPPRAGAVKARPATTGSAKCGPTAYDRGLLRISAGCGNDEDEPLEKIN